MQSVCGVFFARTSSSCKCHSEVAADHRNAAVEFRLTFCKPESHDHTVLSQYDRSQMKNLSRYDRSNIQKRDKINEKKLEQTYRK